MRSPSRLRSRPTNCAHSNKHSTGKQLDSATIAKDWLTKQGLLA